jgi:predicted sulfurtransferase
MASDNTVIIDVRNAYESAIATFAHHRVGLSLLIRKCATALNFQKKWLADEQT